MLANRPYQDLRSLHTAYVSRRGSARLYLLIDRENPKGVHSEKVRWIYTFFFIKGYLNFYSKSILPVFYGEYRERCVSMTSTTISARVIGRISPHFLVRKKIVLKPQ